MVKVWSSILASAFLSCSLCTACVDADDAQPFAIKPYLQIGDPAKGADTTEEVTWVSDAAQNNWQVDYKNEKDSDWKPVASTNLSSHPLLDVGRGNLVLHRCTLHNLVAGQRFQYQVKQNGIVRLASNAVAPKNKDQASRIALFGDCGYGSKEQGMVANQCFKLHPDLVIIPGDVAYNMGTYTDYEKRFFPIYNADQVTAGSVPMLRSTLVVPVIGNHDVGIGGASPVANLNDLADAFAYFTLWDLPQNGPRTKYGEVNTVHLTGKQEAIDRFLKSTDGHFPSQSIYSFDYGNTHWTALDANPYMDCTDQKLRDWIRKDIKGSNAQWKFVVFHQPGFSKDRAHYEEQRMRLLADVFQECGVDACFSGHVHNYQRSLPLHFQAQKDGDKFVVSPDGRVPGQFTLDSKFDGNTVTKADGVIYIVTGGGGARLYGERVRNVGEPEFIKVFNADIHCFTVLDIDGGALSLRQIDENGKIMDEFKITKK